MRTTKKIEIGQHAGRVGFSVYYDNDEKQHFLFDLKTARSLIQGLDIVLKQFEKGQKMADSVMKEALSVSDVAKVQILPGDNKEGLQ